MEEVLKLKFADRMREYFGGMTQEELLSIINEALSFDIKKEDIVQRYIAAYIHFREVFMNKPYWLRYVLKGDAFREEDKLDFIEKKLTAEYGK